MCVCLPVSDQKPILVDCLEVQTIFGAKLLLYSSMVFKVLVFLLIGAATSRFMSIAAEVLIGNQ